MIYNLADTFFVGQIGNPYMVAAVSLVSPWFNLLTALGNLFGLGGGSLPAKPVGVTADLRTPLDLDVNWKDGADISGLEEEKSWSASGFGPLPGGADNRTRTCTSWTLDPKDDVTSVNIQCGSSEKAENTRPMELWRGSGNRSAHWKQVLLFYGSSPGIPYASARHCRQWDN